MGFSATLATLAVAVVVFLVARYFHERPYDPGRLWPVPWLAIMTVATLVTVLMLAHLVSLWTGTRLHGRLGF